jgi:hypothetical protein
MAAITAMAQTKVDVATQTKSIDFSAASSTKPLKTGKELPAWCAIGEMFFKTTAVAGANLFACTDANRWSVQAGNGAGGAVGVAANGALVGLRPTINLITGPGIQSVSVDTGSQVNVETHVDAAVVQSQAGEQSGAALLCASTGRNARDYQCALNPTATQYVTGMVLHWLPDVAAAGGATSLNVDTLGAIPVKMPDGVTDPSATWGPN